MTRVLAYLLLVVLSLLALQTWRLHTAQLDIAQLELADETAKAAAASASERAGQAARETEWSSVLAIFDAGAAYERGKQHAQDLADRVVADLSDGSLRLRREWAVCETARLAEGAAAERTLGGAEQRRNELVAAVLRVGATCDAKVASLQLAYSRVAAAINRESVP